MTAIRIVVSAAFCRPGLVLFSFLLRSLFALWLSCSWTEALAPGWVMAHKSGDRALFAPGCEVLVKVLAEQKPRFERLLRADMIFGIAMIVVGGVLSAIMLCALAEPSRTKWTVVLRRAFRISPKIVSMTMACWLTTASILMFAKFTTPIIPALVYPLTGEMGADCALILLMIVTVIAVFVTFTVGDLARALATNGRTGLVTTCIDALECLKFQFGKCVVAAAIFAVPTIVGPPLIEMWLLSVHAQGTFALALSVSVHQLTVLGLCSLHLGWWAFALKVVQVPSIQNEPWARLGVNSGRE